MKTKTFEMKVSGTGFLCIRNAGEIRWMVGPKLDENQLKSLSDAMLHLGTSLETLKV